jgi:hypothetical protein
VPCAAAEYAAEEFEAAQALLVAAELGPPGKLARPSGRPQLAVETRDVCPSNPEIGAPTVCQPAQVEWHLKKAFTKLGIRSRDQGI